MRTLVTMYSRRNCHLCEAAKEVVESARNEAEFEFELVFIDGDAGLEKEYGEEVPVTLINGRRHDYFQIDALRFIAAILSTSSNENNGKEIYGKNNHV